jgi:hypothetical protein
MLAMVSLAAKARVRAAGRGVRDVVVDVAAGVEVAAVPVETKAEATGEGHHHHDVAMLEIRLGEIDGRARCTGRP